MSSPDNLPDALVDAIHRGDLPATLRRLAADHGDDELHRRATRALAALHRRQHDDTARWSRRLTTAAIAHRIPEPETGSLISVPEFRVAPDAVDAAIAVAEDHGLRRWAPTSGSAAEAVRRTTDRVVLASTADEPERIVIRWAERPPRLARIAPREPDLRGPALPRALWPVHLLRRLVRVAAERAGRRGPAPDLGPLLVTPMDVARGLAAALELSADDVVVDLGCGDGRLLQACLEAGAGRARGIELDAGVAEDALDRLDRSGLGGRAVIDTGDADTAPLGDATVVVMFIAAWAAAEQVGKVLARVPPGTRVVAHELEPIHADRAPDRRRPIVTDGGITVMHEWVAGGGAATP